MLKMMRILRRFMGLYDDLTYNSPDKNDVETVEEGIYYMQIPIQTTTTISPKEPENIPVKDVVEDGSLGVDESVVKDWETLQLNFEADAHIVAIVEIMINTNTSTCQMAVVKNKMKQGHYKNLHDIVYQLSDVKINGKRKPTEEEMAVLEDYEDELITNYLEQTVGLMSEVDIKNEYLLKSPEQKV